MGTSTVTEGSRPYIHSSSAHRLSASISLHLGLGRATATHFTFYLIRHDQPRRRPRLNLPGASVPRGMNLLNSTDISATLRHRHLLAPSSSTIPQSSTAHGQRVQPGDADNRTIGSSTATRSTVILDQRGEHVITRTATHISARVHHLSSAIISHSTLNPNTHFYLQPDTSCNITVTLSSETYSLLPPMYQPPAPNLLHALSHSSG